VSHNDKIIHVTNDNSDNQQFISLDVLSLRVWKRCQVQQKLLVPLTTSIFPKIASNFGSFASD